MNAQSFAALREGCNEVSQRNLTKVAQHEVLGLASLKSHPSRTGRSTNAGIPEWRARPKAKRFYRPGWDGRVFLLHFPALRTGLLSPNLSGTSPHRAILSTYVDAHGLCFRGPFEPPLHFVSMFSTFSRITNHLSPGSRPTWYYLRSPRRTRRTPYGGISV